MTEELKIRIEDVLKKAVSEAKDDLWEFCKLTGDSTRLNRTIDVSDMELITVDYDA